MNLSEVLKLEREKRGLSVAEVAARLDIPGDRYLALEDEASALNEWGTRLGKIAVSLGVPMSRLICRSGRAADAAVAPGRCGALIRETRSGRGMTAEGLADRLSIRTDELDGIEAGRSPIEEYGPLLLRFAELIEQPVFNLLCPSGIPVEGLED
jgi:transcriptional regulator with XRE-family HTH domain